MCVACGPVLAPIILKNEDPTFLLVKDGDCFSSLVKGIIFQQISVHAGRAILKRLATVCGVSSRASSIVASRRCFFRSFLTRWQLFSLLCFLYFHSIRTKRKAPLSDNDFVDAQLASIASKVCFFCWLALGRVQSFCPCVFMFATLSIIQNSFSRPHPVEGLQWNPKKSTASQSMGRAEAHNVKTSWDQSQTCEFCFLLHH